MSTFIIKDEDGNLLDGLYQWDVGIKLNISGISLKDANARVHFVSKDDNEALVVVPTVSNNNTSLTVTIPTILLQKTDPIVAYIYDRVGPNGGKKTKYFIRIPIEPRMKPAGYNYTETADIVYEHIDELTQLAELIRTGMASNINTSGSIHADGDISTDGDISAVGLIRTDGDITADGYVEADLDLIAGKDVKAYGGIYQWIDGEWKPIATRQYVDNKTQPATASSLGVVKVGDGLSVENDGTLKVSSDIRDKAALVTKDGSSAKYSGDVYANTNKKLATEEYVNNHTPNAATNDSLGTVKVGGGLNVANDGTVSVNTNEIATRSYADGKASAAEENAKADAHSYTDTEVAKRASKSAYGTMKVGDGLSVGSHSLRLRSSRQVRISKRKRFTVYLTERTGTTSLFTSPFRAGPRPIAGSSLAEAAALSFSTARQKNRTSARMESTTTSKMLARTIASVMSMKYMFQTGMAAEHIMQLSLSASMKHWPKRSVRQATRWMRPMTPRRLQQPSPPVLPLRKLPLRGLQIIFQICKTTKKRMAQGLLMRVVNCI